VYMMTYDLVYEWEPFTLLRPSSRLPDSLFLPHECLYTIFHQLWGSISFYTPNLEPSNLHLHLLHSLSIFVVCIRQSKQMGRDEEWNLKYEECKTDRTVFERGAGYMIGRALQDKQVEINRTESMRGNVS